jgi:hypothetical protein
LQERVSNSIALDAVGQSVLPPKRGAFVPRRGSFPAVTLFKMRKVMINKNAAPVRRGD